MREDAAMLPTRSYGWLVEAHAYDGGDDGGIGDGSCWSCGFRSDAPCHTFDADEALEVAS